MRSLVHKDDPALAGPARDRSHALQASQSMIVAPAQGIGSLASSMARTILPSPGKVRRTVMSCCSADCPAGLLPASGEPFGHNVEPPCVAELAVDPLQPCRDGREMAGRSLDRSRGDED